MKNPEVDVGACRTVLLDVLTVLGAYLDQVVVVGGWVPELLFPDQGHIGSLDVDLALDGRKIKPAAYDTILKRLEGSGYRQKDPGVSNVFIRDVPGTHETITVKLDLVTGEHDGSLAERSHQHIHGMNVPMLKGMGLALDSCTEIRVTGRLPDGAKTATKARIPTMGAFVCIKSITMTERRKPKDAYDIYFCLKQFPGGPQAFAESLRSIRGIKEVEEGLQAMRLHFSTIEHVGPIWASQVAAEHGDDVEFVKRDAFERAKAFLDAAGVPPSGEK